VSLWMIFQVVMNISLALFVYVIWVKLRRPPQDDPRLSKGLQLLQSKISVLEDLSDKTEIQVEKLSTFLDKKIKLVQNTIQEADQKILLIQQATQKTKEVAEIFQDEIPHDEIVKRQNTVKYVRAAKLAHQGHSVEEISAEIDLPIAEIELIAKLNKDNLVFDDESLPEWARHESNDKTNLNWQIPSGEMEPDLSDSLNATHIDYSSLKKLGEQFRQACQDYEIKQSELETNSLLNPLDTLKPKDFEVSQVVDKIRGVTSGIKNLTQNVSAAISQKITAPEAKVEGRVLESRLETKIESRGETKLTFNTQSAPLVIGNLQTQKKMNLNQGDVIKKVQFPTLQKEINTTKL